MKKISIEEANSLIFDMLRREHIEDRFYELACDLFQKYVTKIAEENEIEDWGTVDEEGGEMWYDESQDEFLRCAFARIKEFVEQ